jgi:quinol monooxygenase YgiN
MTPPVEKVSQSALDGSRTRVVLLLEVEDGAEQRLLEAYDQMCQRVAAVPGHISDQLCQSIENPSQWLITSEWESALTFLAWVDSPAHLEMVEPLHGCVRDTRSLRFGVLRETAERTSAGGTLQTTPRIGDGMVRHAITFTVKPGSEAAVAEILAGYSSPQARVDDTTSLRRTSLFMHGNRVVRAVEVHGELVKALRHVAEQPEVRAVEEAINPYLEVDRDLSDPHSARKFFTRAALPAVHHVAARADGHSPDLRRHALFYPTKEGCGQALARLLARQDESAVDDPKSPIAGSTVFLREHEDIVVRLVDLRVPIEEAPLAAVGAEGPHRTGVLARLLAEGVDLTHAQGIKRFLTDYDMRLVTDRRAPGD